MYSLYATYVWKMMVVDKVDFVILLEEEMD